MSKLFVFMRTALSMFMIVIIIALFFIPGVIYLMLPLHYRENRLGNAGLWLLYTLFVKATFLHVTVVGKENIPYNQAVIAANHQSALDIPLVGMVLGGHPHIWLALAYLKDAWYLRYVLARMAVLVDVSSAQRAARSLIGAITKLQATNLHAVIFPEGGRFIDGQVHDFYAGFVILAKKLGCPVVPVRIFNIQKAFPPKSLLLHRVPIKIVIGEPMAYLETDTDDIFKKRVHDWFIAQQ
jgi:1-acyl-sn-glycerol-3-phosphate acyltransferase